MIKLTVSISLILSLLAGGLQLYLDLYQEVGSVEVAATSVIDGLVPAATSALWDFDEEGASQVIDGLFLTRSVSKVTVLEGDEIFIERSRDLVPTVPILARLVHPPTLVINRDLIHLAGTNQEVSNVIGQLVVVVERTMIPPNVMSRIITYFAIAFLKNILLCACLVIFAFSGLARHILAVASLLSNWRVIDGGVKIGDPPKYLSDTEMDQLGRRIESLTSFVSREITSLKRENDTVSVLNSELIMQSEGLHKTLEETNLELEIQNRKLVDLAIRDGLTGAFNRRHFDGYLTALWNNPQTDLTSVSVLMIDIDFFKRYNDHFGHGMGDDCLQRVAQTLQQVSEEQGAIFARYGGEEFIVVTCVPSSAPLLAQRFVEEVRDLQIPHPKSLAADYITISLGFAENKTVLAQQSDDLVLAADSALYNAKSHGRDRFMAAPEEFLEDWLAETEFEAKVRKVVSEGRIVPYYQPQFDARNGQIVGVEVLARSIANNEGTDDTTQLYDVANKLGITAQVDAVVQVKALTDLAGWMARRRYVNRMSMNVCEEALLTGQIEKLFLDQTDRTRQLLSFKFLESIQFEEQSKEFNWRLESLLSLGAEIEIDDFGTGSTSIAALNRLAPKRLKIARELVAPLCHVEDADKPILVILEIAKVFDIDLIAEGVETSAQAERLMSLGIPIQQGFFHAHPMCAEDFERLLQERDIRKPA